LRGYFLIKIPILPYISNTILEGYGGYGGYEDISVWGK
jgi:hypothetical protein